MADSKPVKQEVNGTVILPPLAFPGLNTVKGTRQHANDKSHNTQHNDIQHKRQSV